MKKEVDVYMAKAGMRRPDPSEPHGTESNKINKKERNKLPEVPEIQGKAKKGHEKAGKFKQHYINPNKNMPAIIIHPISIIAFKI